MNYYHEWWENARRQRALILTKPKERELLIKRIKELKQEHEERINLLINTSVDAHNYLDLEQERDDLKIEIERQQEELRESKENNDYLTDEITRKEERIK